MEYSEHLERIRNAKIFALKRMGKFRKAMPIFRVDDLWLNESKFVIKFKMDFFPIYPMINLCIGDVCRIRYDFYASLLRGSSPDNWNASRPLKDLLAIPKGDPNRDNEFVLTSFVEMSGNYGKELFCALRLIPDAEFLLDNILTAKDGRSLLLFWPESLEKIR
jgi:hypothetical protein